MWSIILTTKLPARQNMLIKQWEQCVCDVLLLGLIVTKSLRLSCPLPFSSDQKRVTISPTFQDLGHLNTVVCLKGAYALVKAIVVHCIVLSGIDG